MTKQEALEQIAQTLLRVRGFTAEIDALPGPLTTETVPMHLRITLLGNIARTVADAAKLFEPEITQTNENAAVWELGRRYCVWT